MSLFSQVNPGPREIVRFLERARRRLVWLGVAEGTAAGLAVALLATLGAVAVGGTLTTAGAALVALAGAAAGSAVALLRLYFGDSVAARVEQRAPASRNVVLTAAELIDGPARVSPYIRGAVCVAAARVLQGVEPRQLFPARRATAVFAASTSAWTLLLVSAMTGAAPGARPGELTIVTATGAPAILAVDVVITTPAHIGQPPQRLSNPQRIDVLNGSRLTVTVRASAAAVSAETLAGPHDMARTDEGTFTTVLRADSDGFLALEPRLATGEAGARRLIGLTVRPDHPPVVRITAPGRDLVLPHGEQAVDLAVTATDDHGLASLRLSFTRITGFGEQFTFTEAEVPLQVTRTGARTWRARAHWPLQPLQLRPGDMLVYRAIAADRRPGAAPGESDTYMIEVVSAAAVASGGVAMDDEFDRYALSQQMVILLTERLLAKRASLSPAEFAAEAQVLAAAQRRVRAEFVFMLGGELEEEHEGEDPAVLHEEAHALVEAELAAGRLANQGRIELTRAIRAMSAAATQLTRVEVEPALVAEKQALLHVQRAFARTRYILRALTERERIDLSRRLTGALAGVLRDVRPRRVADTDPARDALRRALADVASLASARATEAAAAEAARLAQAVLRVDPSSQPLQNVAGSLSAAADALADGSAATARAALDQAITGLTAFVRPALPVAPGPRRTLRAEQLDGALADMLRGGSR
ncbi:MAG TPA: hypothetical protein VMN60_01580 [Longimicrobiales bacterium]|nr:hypothetical protein [Longimicrobiales bacterium]